VDKKITWLNTRRPKAGLVWLDAHRNNTTFIDGDVLADIAADDTEISVDTIIIEDMVRRQSACGRVVCSNGEVVMFTVDIAPRWQFIIDLHGNDDFIREHQALLTNAVNIEILAKVA